MVAKSYKISGQYLAFKQLFFCFLGHFFFSKLRITAVIHQVKFSQSLKLTGHGEACENIEFGMSDRGYQFIETIISNNMNRNFFRAVSVSCYGHGGAVGQFMLHLYYTMFTSSSEWSPVLNIPEQRLRRLCVASVRWEAQDEFINGNSLLMCPFLLGRMFEADNIPFHNIILVAKDSVSAARVEAQRNASTGKPIYECYQDVISGWKFFLSSCLGGAAAIQSILEHAEREACFLVVRGDHLHAMQRCMHPHPDEKDVGRKSQLFGPEFHARRYEEAFQALMVTDSIAAVALLCRDLFTVLYAEPLLNFAFPEVPSVARDAVGHPALVAIHPLRVRYLTARTCAPESMVKALRARHPDRIAFEELAEAVERGDKSKYRSIVLEVLSQVSWLGTIASALVDALDTHYFRHLALTGRGVRVQLTCTIGPGSEAELDLGLMVDRSCRACAPMGAGFYDRTYPVNLLKTAQAAHKHMLTDLQVEKFHKDPEIACIGWGLGTYSNHACMIHCSGFPAPTFIVPHSDFPMVVFADDPSAQFNSQLSAVRTLQKGASLEINYNSLHPIACAGCMRRKSTVRSLRGIRMPQVIEQLSPEAKSVVRVAPSTLHGYGLFATALLSTGHRCADFTGTFYVLSEEECAKHPNVKNMLRVLLGKDVYVDPTPLSELPFMALVDQDTGYAFTAGFANSCTFTARGTLEPPPNAQFEAIVTEDGNIEVLTLVALRDISYGEEVIVDYHWSFQEHCECYHEECRRMRRKLAHSE